MKKIVITLSLAALILCTATSCIKETYGNLNATIEGFVIDQATGMALGNVLMTLSSGEYSTTYTGSDGFYQFIEVKPNIQQSIQAQKEGYVDNRKYVVPRAGETINVNIVMKKQQ